SGILSLVSYSFICFSSLVHSVIGAPNWRSSFKYNTIVTAALGVGMNIFTMFLCSPAVAGVVLALAIVPAILAIMYQPNSKIDSPQNKNKDKSDLNKNTSSDFEDAKINEQIQSISQQRSQMSMQSNNPRQYKKGGGGSLAWSLSFHQGREELLRLRGGNHVKYWRPNIVIFLGNQEEDEKFKDNFKDNGQDQQIVISQQKCCEEGMKYCNVIKKGGLLMISRIHISSDVAKDGISPQLAKQIKQGDYLID
ncbi:MAG: hypothetical protein EZS28_053789, partial [Streblomastix strix]